MGFSINEALSIKSNAKLRKQNRLLGPKSNKSTLNLKVQDRKVYNQDFVKGKSENLTLKISK
jgi:hypothetical protein